MIYLAFFQAILILTLAVLWIGAEREVSDLLRRGTSLECQLEIDWCIPTVQVAGADFEVVLN